MHSVLEQRKQWQKQYISVGKTDLSYNSMGLCRNFNFFFLLITFVDKNVLLLTKKKFSFWSLWERTAESLLIDDYVVKSLGSWCDCICIGFESWRIQHFLSLWLLHCRQCSVLDWSITHHLLPCGWLLQSQDTGCLAEGIFSGECSVIQFCSVLAQMTRAGQRNWFNFFKSWKILK